jgi:predicted YcjX-like family ATPase
MQARYDKFEKEIVKSYFSGEIKETAKKIINDEYITALKHGDNSAQAMEKAADELGCSKRTVRRNIYGY